MPAPFLNANSVELILQNFDQRINITLYDEDGDPVDATYLRLQVMDIGKTVLYEDDYVVPPSPPTRIIKPAGTTGQYYIAWGDPTAPANVPDQTETNLARDLFFVWRAIGGVGTEPAVILQVVKVVDPRVLAFLPPFRLQIDKAVKLVEEATNLFAGYSDAQLLMYLEGGLNIINTYQPNTNIVLENYPFRTHGQLLVDTATLVALQSQTLFAVDTDLVSYSDQGYSFAINHQQPLQSFLSFLQQRLDRLVPLLKLNYATMGSIHLQAGVSFRLMQLLQAAPSGVLFRGFLST